MAEIPSLPGRIGDETVELREIEAWDIPEVLIAYQDDKGMHRRLGYRRPPTGAQLGRQVELAQENRRSGRSVSLTICEIGENYCRGRVDVHQIDWRERSAELGIWVAPRFRGRGLATHALEHATRWLFEVVGLRRLELRVEADNAAMLAVGAACGYTTEPARGRRLVLVRVADDSHGR